MKLKTKFSIISVIVIGLTLSVALFVSIQVQELETAIEENRVAAEVMKGVFELNLLTSDYLLHPGERNREQWQLRYQSIENLLQIDTEKMHVEHLMLLDTLRQDHELIQTTFLKLTENLESQEVSLELNQRLEAQLLMKSQTMLFAASRFMEVSRLELTAIQQETCVFVMIAIAILAGILLLVLLVLSRGILEPVLLLQKGAEIIGTGNLKHTIDIERKDEIGNLAKSFNYMGQKLSKSYASLEQKIKELKELDELKDNFLNTTSHELKTPLAPIKSQLQLLMAGDFGKLNKEQQESLEMIFRNEERLNRLVSDVLDISRIRSHKLKLILEKFSLAKVIQEVVKEMKPVARNNKIDLTVKLADLPMTTGDPHRIAQVIGNLFNNAIKFTPKKGEITVEAEAKEKELMVKVIDTGIGISPKNLKKLFTPFLQLETGLSRKHGGTGLGLVISKGIVEAHGGKIWAESKGKDKGSTFSFTLPIIKNK